MAKDGIFNSNEIVTSNLSKITFNQSVLEEKRICEISSLVYDAVRLSIRMVQDGYGIYEILSVISDGIFSASYEPHSFALSENYSKLKSFLSFASAIDKSVFTEMFVDAALKSGIELSEKSFLQTGRGNETFTYVKNPLADEAYDVFSQEFDDPHVKYSKSLSEAAKAVSSGEVEYALLPLEERGGARLAAVASILYKEDLKINSVTPVFGYEGNADMKYALVSKHFSVPDFVEDDDRYLEIRIRQDSSISLSELFLASESLGTTLYRINTISFDTDDGPVMHYSVVFRDEGKDFSLLLVYLTLFSGSYTPIGIYKNLE